MSKKRQFSIIQITTPFLIMVIALFAALVIIELNANKIIEDKVAAVERYALCMDTAGNFHFGTEILTNEARTFVAGQGIEHFDRYVKEGKSEKIKQNNAIKKLEKSGADARAIAALKKGYSLSESLAKREMLAMTLAAKANVYGKNPIQRELSDYPIPDIYKGLTNGELLNAANHLLFGTDYINYKSRINESISNCTERAESVHHEQWEKDNIAHNQLRDLRNLTYLILFLLMMCFVILFSKTTYGNVIKMINAIRSDKPMRSSNIKCYNYLVGAYNTLREKLYAELQQSKISGDELETSMKETGRFISTYDIQAKRYTVHEEIAKRLNIKTVFEDMPHDFLAAVTPLLDEESKEDTEAFYNGMLSGSPEGKMEVRIKTSTGRIEWERCSYRTIFNENNEPIRAIITIADITSEKKQALFYDEYILSIENRVLSGRGIFLWIDVTNQKLLKNSQYLENDLRKAPVNSLEELFKQFDEFKIFTQNGESFRKIFDKNVLLRHFELGNHDLITHWQTVKSDGTILQLETLTLLVSNPTTGSTEAAIQIYPRNNANFLKSTSIKAVLFIQNPGQQRDVLANVLMPYFNIKVADSCEDAKLLLEMKPDFSIVLLDLDLADENPLDFIRETKKIRRTMPILAITDGSVPEELNALEAGVADVQSRPINTTLIRHRINNMISKQEALSTIQSDIDHRDEVTGLLGRKSFITLANEIVASSTDNENFVMLCMDVASFRLINSRFGNHTGEEILKLIGETIQRAIEGTLGVAMRARSDRFYALVPNDQSLIDALCNSIGDLDYKLPMKVIVRIGIYEPEIGETVEDMMAKVFLVIDYLRENKIETIARFKDKMLDPLILKLRIVEDFRAAIREEQIVPYFQPKYNYSKKCYAGAEALVRWIHPALGFLAPDKFIPVFEKRGLIAELDLYILEKVCQYQRKWKDEGCQTMCVSVNLSPVDFSDLELAEKVLQIIDKYNLTGNDIRFEITETSYTNDATLLISFINKVHKKGFLVDMDDFGSGYSTLDMLYEVNADALKLDTRMTCNNKSEYILGAVIRMAGWLKMDILAEGVETETQAEYLHNLGCAYMQGFYFSKPLPAIAYRELLVENRKKIQNGPPQEIKERGISLINPTTLNVDDVGTFLKTVGKFFPLIIAQNYSKNTYYIMEYDNFETKAVHSKGLYDDLIIKGATTFHPNEKQTFLYTFRRETIVSLFEEGHSHFTHIGRQLSDTGEYHWIRTNVLVYRDVDGDIKGYSLSRNVDDEFNNRSESEGYQKVITGMSRAFICVFEIDVLRGLVKTIHTPAEQSEYIAPISNFEESFNAWASRDLSPEDYEKYSYFWDFSDITERIDTNTNTTITFNTKITGWQTASLVELERDTNGKVIKVLWLAQNVNEEKQQEMVAEDVKEAFAEAYDIAYRIDLHKNLCYELKGDNRLRKIIPPVANISEVVHNYIAHGVSKEHQAIMLDFANLDTLNERLLCKKSISTEYKGKLFAWLRANIVPITYYENGKIKQFIFGITVIEKEKLAELDGITGLLNSKTAQEQIEKKFHNGEGIGGVLLIVDIDDLKYINDSKGHQAGSDAICGVASCIKSKFRSTDIIGRYGGDEFIIFLKGYEDREEQLKEKLQSLLNDIASKDFSKDSDYKVTCTIGAATATKDTESFEKLFEKADYALYNAKKESKNSYKFHVE